MNKKPLYLVIVGPSGGGKGTQAKLLAKKFGLKHISMGALFRQEIDGKSKVGLAAKSYVIQGLWVPTEITFLILEPVLKKSFKEGFIIDGFPRLPDQPALLDEFLVKQGEKLDSVIHLKVRPEVIMARREKLAAKGKVFYPHQKRKDESKKAIISRLAAYEKTIRPILVYYKKKGILAEIDGEQKVGSIHQEILGLIKKRVKK